jgi:hypothetical protein
MISQLANGFKDAFGLNDDKFISRRQPMHSQQPHSDPDVKSRNSVLHLLFRLIKNKNYNNS